MSKLEEELPQNNGVEKNGQVKSISLGGMYRDYFLDYASYVILERAVPAIEDGLKPVQRRILHSMYELEDGRFNKVANIIGNTMKYHPHGDASIGDAIVQMGQKDLLIDTQGNWGNILTGDSAAASRYIEARLTKFALDVVFNPKTTRWQLSYDGRNKEPITFPMKFPLLLAQGVEGIAVGLACKILPHNFNELIDGCVDILRGKEVQIFPDFPTGGYVDVSKYNDGLRGGKIRVRAVINILDNKTLVITQIPFGTTTGSLIDSIVNANEKGKIKIKKVEDNTAENVEILVHLPPGVSPDKTIDALYAFTDCEVSISPNSGVIRDEKPAFLGVSELLKDSVKNTVELLKLELKIREGELQEQLLFSSLEKIFIENRIYRDIEECETWEEVLATIDKGLKPFKPQFYREIKTEDIVKLTEIRIKRISKFDGFKADEMIKKLNDELKEVRHSLDNIIDFAIDYYLNLKKKYGKGRERKTEIRSFETIEATEVAARTEKLYWDKENGLVGYNIKGAESIADCSNIDDIIIFREDGTMMVTKINEKFYVGKNVIHVDVWKKDDERTIYHLIYRDGKNGNYMMKRFAVTSIIRDKEYDLTKGTKDSKVIYFSVNPNGESETLTVYLKPKPKLRKQIFDVDLGEISIKGRNAQGNILSKLPIRKIVRKSRGESTLDAQELWFDEFVKKINTEGRGRSLGMFGATDMLLCIMKNGTYRLVKPDASLHFEEGLEYIKKYKKGSVISAVYFDKSSKEYYVKRFLPEQEDKIVFFVPENEPIDLVFYSVDKLPRIAVTFLFGRNKEEKTEVISLAEFIAVKGEKARGNKLNFNDIKRVIALEPLEEQEEEPTQETISKVSSASGSIVKEDTLEINLNDDPQQTLFE